MPDERWFIVPAQPPARSRCFAVEAPFVVTEAAAGLMRKGGWRVIEVMPVPETTEIPYA